MTCEKEFVKWIHRQFSLDHFVRLESTTERGIPDINVCRMGKEVWIEAKIETSYKVLLRPEQYAWGMRGASNLRSVYVVSCDLQRGIVKVWKYPAVQVEPKGKYVLIVSAPMIAGNKNSVNLHTIVFT
jgi:hypothetical protein